MFLILFFWLMVTPDNGPILISGPSTAAARLQRQRHAHGVLNSTKWGDFLPRRADDPLDATPRYLNLTGFRDADGYAWEDLGVFRDRCREWSRNAYAGTGSDDWNRPSPTQLAWKNATGRVRGEWVRRPGISARQATFYNLSAIAPEVSWQAGHGDWSRNVTGGHGKVSVNLEEYDGTAEYVEDTDEEDLRSAAVVREISASATLQD